MKEYKDEYEKIFTNPDRINRACDLGHVSFYKDIPKSSPLFIDAFREEIRKFDLDTFDHLVKIDWLRYRFQYKGLRRQRGLACGRDRDWAHGVFMRSIVGVSLAFLSAEGNIFRPIRSYFFDFFPDFDESNPFETKYEYPYETVGFNHLCLVSLMEERMDLIAIAEKRKMLFPEFADYVLNYVSCLNAELLEDKYEFLFRQRAFPFVRKVIRSTGKRKRHGQ